MKQDTMRHDIINYLATEAPNAGHSLHFARLDGTESIDHKDFHDRAGRVAARLRRAGVRAGDRIGVLAANCLEWALLDLAVLRLGAVTVGFELGKFDPDPSLKTKYGLKLLFTDRPVDSAVAAGIRELGEVRRLADLPGPAREVAAHYAPQDMVALKLTSGTTGEPKGMGASAGSINSSLNAVQEMFAHGSGDNIFVFLPLSLLQQRYWIYSALYFGHDVTVSTYEAAFPTLGRVAPTVVMGVPGFFETAKRHIETQAARAKRPIAEQAKRFFGPNIRYLWTGSAPATGETLRFFNDCGLPIFEGYGLNETCIVTKNYPGSCREGSVGKVLPGKQVLLDENSVISVRCDHPVSTRYEYAKPGESERVFPGDGLVRTNDIGFFDADGFLYISGRADDVIVLENGKKVIVRPLEEDMKTSPAIEECVIFCPTSTHLVAVVSPAADDPDETAIAEQLTKTNAAFGADEQISMVIVAGTRFSVANGMLTSQLKPKRRQIFQTFRTQIDDRRSGIHAN